LECLALVRQSAFPSRVIRVNVGWLERQIHTFRGLEELCRRPYDDYRHGVIYAVRFDQTQLDGISWGNMGIESLRVIEPNAIIGKVALTDEQSKIVSDLKPEEDSKMVSLLMEEDSLVSALRRQKERRLIPPANTQQVLTNLPVAPEAGEDDALAIVEEFGSVHLIDCMRASPYRRNGD
jgi:hypothetical protein